MDLGLTGKRALVLGSSKGLGHGIAEQLAAEGAHVTLVGRNEDRLRQAAGSLVTRDHFERLAVRRLIEDLMSEQASLTRAISAKATTADGADESRAGKVVADWIGPRAAQVEQVRRTIDEIEQGGQGWSFAKLTIANVALRDLATSA